MFLRNLSRKIYNRFATPSNPVAGDASGRLRQYKYRESLALKTGGAATTFLGALIIAVVATDFSKHAPPWLRVLTFVVFIIVALCIVIAWSGFHWAAESLERDLAAGPVDNPRGWPLRPEVAWTTGLYLFIVDSLLLVAVVVLALI